MTDTIFLTREILYYLILGGDYKCLEGLLHGC